MGQRCSGTEKIQIAIKLPIDNGTGIMVAVHVRHLPEIQTFILQSYKYDLALTIDQPPCACFGRYFSALTKRW